MGGLALAGPASRAQVVACPPTEPIERLFTAITDAASAGTLALTRPRRVGAALKLFQPVHRVLHFVLLDLFCETPGAPRLDPRKVDSAGVVVRRLRTVNRRERTFERYKDGSGRYRTRERWISRQEVVRERWVVESGRVLGWQTVVDPAEDPDPKRRTGTLTGVVALDRALAIRRAQRAQARWEERSGSLFIAPPEVCAAVGRTVVYGLVPTASSEVTDPAPTTYDAALVDAILPSWLKQGGWRLAAWPAQGVTAEDVQDPATGAIPAGLFGEVTEEDAADWVEMLRQLRFLLGAFEDDPTAAELRAVLSGLQVLRADWTPGSLLDFVRDASDALVGGAVGAGGDLVRVTQPIFWPEITAATAARIADLAGRLLVRRSAQAAPEGRYEDLEAAYVAIPFARVKAEEGCPPRLVWGPETEPFRIAPWFEGSEDGAPVARIQLPDLTRDSVRQLAPNVAFLLPPSVKAFLDANNPKDLLAGDVKEAGAGLGIQFICSFNIPIITLCAFILLWVIIILLNIVFWWIPFIMICLPFPKKES
ncbi:MAG TPA: hypothetical protein PKA64_03655 [Myxococcota bacterium]|nr:hypothetical protein [Myxococcota bacterium]